MRTMSFNTIVGWPVKREIIEGQYKRMYIREDDIKYDMTTMEKNIINSGLKLLICRTYV